MPDNVNTTPLELARDERAAAAESKPDTRPVMVGIDHVSMVFNMANQQLNSLKEYAIALARRELMFKEFRALDDVSFTVRKGDVFGILGTNGSGKSTMMKIIAGVLEPSQGTCTVNGNIAPLIELGAGFDMELTARENIFLNGALLGYSKKFIQQHFDEIVEFAEIEKFLDMPMKNYSSGMVARIAFAIATVIVPEILIVDEVLSVGDFMFQQKCERRINTLIKEHEVTVLIVSHNNDQIERLCNKAIWIEKGHTRMIGSAADVCRTYRVLGGHVGSPEAEASVFGMLNEQVKVPKDAIDTLTSESRYGTAVKLMQECEFEQGGSVILASGEHPLPCMSAIGLSGMLDAPVLLSKPDTLPDVTAQALGGLLPKRVVLIGGEPLLSSQVEERVRETCGADCVIERVLGDESVAASRNVFSYGQTTGGAWSRSAVIAHHNCMGDMITLSPYFLQERTPIFFVDRDLVVGEETARVIQSGAFNHLMVFGGKRNIPDEFLEQCEAAGVTCERLWGHDPYDANEKFNGYLLGGRFASAGVNANRLIVSAVWNPADALTAAAYAHRTHSAFLLEDPQNLDSVAHALAYVGKLEGAVRHLTFLGDGTQFTKLDKELLGKAVQLALVKAGLAGDGSGSNGSNGDSDNPSENTQASSENNAVHSE